MKLTECDLAGFDLESTGVKPRHDVPVSWALVTRREGQMNADFGYINPGISIPEGATAIHGITDETVKSAPPLEDEILRIANSLAALSREDVPLIGMNIAYDLTMIDSCLQRMFETTLTELGWDGPAIDLLVLDRHYDKFRPGGRKLSDLCRHYNVIPKGNAHSALADVYAAVRCVQAMPGKEVQREYKRKKYTTTPAADIEVLPARELHRLQAFWHHQQMRSLSDHFDRTGQPPISEDDYGWPIHGIFPPTLNHQPSLALTQTEA